MGADGREGNAADWMRVCRSFIDSVGDQMLVISKDYEVLLANRAFVQRTGLTEHQVIGRRCHEVTHRSDKPCWMNGHACPLASVLESGTSTQVTHEHYDSRGEPQYVDIVGSPATDGRGRVVGLIESIRDVTKEKRLETALRERNAELELARDKHQQFISTVCHELKNILNSVSLNAQLLSLESQSEKTQRRTRFIVDDSRRLERLIEDMRDAAAIETQRFSVRKQPADLRKIVSDCVESRRLAGPRHAFVAALPSERVEGVWDSGRLRQVVENLVSNAVKFSPEGSEIRVAVEVDADRVQVSVSDRGMGIPSKALPGLFQPYARAHSAVPGIGLGLFLSRSIVEAHGGEISAESTEGRGSTFRFWLPLQETPPPATVAAPREQQR